MSPLPKKRSQSATQKDVFGTAMDLATLMKDDPTGVDQNLRREGEELIGVFQDSNYREGFQDLRQQKLHTLEMAIRDISQGVLTLRTSTLGISFREGKLIPFMTSHGTKPSGSVVFSLVWKKSKAFGHMRNDPAGDLETTQEEVNAALYRLVVLLSEIL